MTDKTTKEDQTDQINVENQNKEDLNENSVQNDLNDTSNDNKENQTPESNNDTNNNDNADQNSAIDDKLEKQVHIPDYPETQNVEIEHDEHDALSVPESQPNIDEPHGLTGLVKKKKQRRKFDPIKLEDIPSWSDYAPSIYEGKRLPKKEDLIFPPNESINKLISYIPRGDSTILAIDAIVNAANSGLYAGGGICGAIHSAAGPELEEACMKIGGCDTGKAVITPGFDLPSKFVIHAVGPIGQHPEELKSAYEKTLEFIDGKDVRSVALCCISTGIYGYPIRPATKIALKTVREFLENEENQKKTDRIIFVVFNQKDCAVYENFLPYYFPLPEGAINEAKSDDDDDAIKEEEEEEEEDYAFEMPDEESPEVDMHENEEVNLETNKLNPIITDTKETNGQDTKTIETDSQITDGQIADSQINDNQENDN